MSEDESYQGLFEHVPVALCVLDLAGVRERVLELPEAREDLAGFFRARPEELGLLAARIKLIGFNSTALRLLGAESSEGLLTLIAERVGETGNDALTDGVAALDRGALPFVQAVTVQGGDGQHLHLTLSATLLPGGEEQWSRVLVTIKDTTEERQLIAQLIQSQKMEAVGRLAGGIAHDFNNLLTVISGFTTLAREVEDSAELRGIARATERATELTSHLLAFGRRSEIEERTVNLPEALAEVQTILRMVIEENTHLVFSLDPKLGRVRADPGQLQQVLMNLAMNARDAMPSGGWLRIVAENVELSNGPFVRISVTDTGCGMDEKVKARIFEPFFTTKAVGKGSGLGLATAFGIVTRSGGSIAVETELGEGTTFHVTLPQASEPAVPKAAPAEAAEPGGTETILLVEDSEPLLQLTERVLKNAGYAVAAAGLPSEAQRIWAERSNEIHLVLTDVIMPEMDGPSLVRELKGGGGHPPGIYMTGYGEGALKADSPSGKVIRKPFSTALLLQRIREALSAGPVSE
jgi:signal transduction histidine kinase